MAEDSREQGAEPSIDEIVQEAEQRFRGGMRFLNEWGGQANEIIRKQPGVVLAGVAVLGFVTGLLLRRAASARDER